MYNQIGEKRRKKWSAHYTNYRLQSTEVSFDFCPCIPRTTLTNCFYFLLL